MRIGVVVAIALLPGAVRAEIISMTEYKLDLAKPAKGVAWSEPDKLGVTAEGLGWGTAKDEGRRDVWVQTEPVGVGLSWRPTIYTTVRAKVKRPGASGLLYARYSADGKRWTAWQHLDEKGGDFVGTLRVPYREMARYQEMRLEYARRGDVPWTSDEEALVRDIVRREPKFFERATPFVGYVQFLYETQLAGGERMKGLDVSLSWAVSGLHHPPKDPAAEKGRDGPWRFLGR